jgi:glutathione S-transferase
MLKLYYSTATCSTASHIALKESGLPFEGVEVSWNRNVNVDALANVHPLGAVPALVLDSGQTLTQNVAIMEYIADLAPGSRLLAKAGSPERAATIAWASFAGADVQPAFGPILGAKRLTTIEAAKEEMRASATTKLTRYLEHIDQSLAGKNFIMGNDFTVADAYLFTVLGWFNWVEISVVPYKNVHAYMKRVYQRPAVKHVLEIEGLLDYVRD